MPRLGFRRTSLVLTLIIAAAIAAALVAGKVAPRDTAYGPGDAEGAPALSNHLAKLHLASSATFAPPGSSNYREGDATAADEEFAQRAYPGNAHPGGRVAAVAQRLDALRRPRRRGQRPVDAARPDLRQGTPQPVPRPLGLHRRHGELQRRATPSWRSTRTAARRVTVTTTARAPRTTARGTTTTTTATTSRPAASGSRTRTAGSGAPTTRSPRTRSGSTSRACSSTTTPRRSSSIRTTRAATRSGSAPASRTPAAPAARRASASTARRTAVTDWTGPYGAGRVLRPGRRLDRDRAGQLEHHLRRVRPRDRAV